MFIKYSTVQYLKNLVEKGEMYFNPAKKFRELEERQKLKGQGDRHDSGLHSRANAAILERPDGCFVAVRNLDNSVIMGPAQDTPVFCLKCADTEFITNTTKKLSCSSLHTRMHLLYFSRDKMNIELFFRTSDPRREKFFKFNHSALEYFPSTI